MGDLLEPENKEKYIEILTVSDLVEPENEENYKEFSTDG